VNWNAMMASAFLHAGAVLDRPDCNSSPSSPPSDLGGSVGRATGDEPRDRAGRAARLLEDNVHAPAAFLDAYEATGEDLWLTARSSGDAYCGGPLGRPKGGFFDVARDRSGAAYLATPRQTGAGRATPSANASPRSSWPGSGRY